MFKKLKDKIEGVKQPPLKITQAVVSPSTSSVSTNFSIGEDCEDMPKSSPANEGFQAVDLQDVPSPLPSGRRSRQSSVSSVTSDTSSLFPIYEMPAHPFNFQSDLESASEIDESLSSHLAQLSKKDLYESYTKLLLRYNKYKGRSKDLGGRCQELVRDNTKIRHVLLESQEKSLRRINELKEQCTLEQRAKAHLEEALRNDLEEKDHLIQTLQTKVKLLKESSNSGGSRDGENILIDFTEELNSLDVGSVQALPDHLVQFESSKEGPDHNGTLHRMEETFDTNADKSHKKISLEVTSEKVNNSLIEDLNNKIKHLEEKNADLIRLCDDLSEKLVISENTRKTLSKRDNELNIIINETLIQNENLSEELGEKKIEICRYIEEHHALQQKVRELEVHSNCEVDDLKNKLSHFEKEADKLQAKNKELQNELNETLVQIQNLSEELGEKKTEIRRYIEEHHALQRKVRELEAHSNCEVDELKNKLSHFENEADKLQAKNKELEIFIKQLEAEFKDTVYKLQESLSACEGEKEKALLCNNELSRSQSQLKAKLSKVEEERAHFIQENCDLEKSFITLQDDVKKQKCEYEEKIALSEIEKDKYVHSNNELCNSQAQLNAKIEDLSNELQMLKGENELYVKENEDLKKLVQNTNDEFKGQICNLEKKLGLCEEEKQVIVLSNKELTSVNDELNNQINYLNNNVKELQEEVAMYAKENSDLTNSVKHLENNSKEEVHELQKKVCVLEEELTNALLSHDHIQSELNSHIKNLSSKIVLLEQENAAFVKENSELNVLVKEIGSTIASELEEKLNLSEKEKEKIVLLNNELSFNKSQLTKQVEDLTCTLTRIQEENVAFMKENDDLKSSRQEVEAIKENIIREYLEKNKMCEEMMLTLVESRVDMVKAQDRLKYTINTLQEELKNFASKYSDLNSSIESMNDNKEKLSKLEKQVALSEKEKERVFHLNKVLSIHEGELTKELGAVTCTLDKIQEENGDLRSSLKKKEASTKSSTKTNNDEEKLGQLEHSLAYYKDQTTFLKGLIKEFQIKLQMAQNRNEELSASNVNLKADNEDLTLKLDLACNKGSSELQKAALEAREHVRELEVQLMLSHQEREKLNNSRSQLLDINRTLNIQNQILTDKLKKCEVEKSVLCNSKVTLTADVNVLNAENGTSPLNVDELKSSTECTSRHLQLNEVEEKLRATQAENIKLTSKVQSFSKAIDELTNKLESNQCATESLQEEIKKLCEEKKVLQENQTKSMNLATNQYKADLKSLRRKIQHLVVDKIMLKQELNKLMLKRDEKEKNIVQHDEEHNQRIKQLALDFQKQLAEKDQELQDVLTRELEHVKCEDRHEIQQLRTQVRDLIEDSQKGNDAYEVLMEDYKATEQARETDRLLQEQQIKDIRLSHKAEMDDLQKKWRSYIYHEVQNLNDEHMAEVAALSREWQCERKELENASQLAITAMESGRGSIELLQKQLVAVTQELKEVKQNHKSEIEELNSLLSLRQKSEETLGTSTEDCVQMEYLRSIVYKYMMGDEPLVLAKVIGTILKFKPDQVDQVYQKELSKQTLLGQLGIL